MGESDRWVLSGDLDGIEGAIANYIWRRGQHLDGVHPDSIAGTPVAAANMAMTVIRKNVQRIAVPRPSRLRRIGRALATGGLSLIFERRKHPLGPEGTDG